MTVDLEAQRVALNRLADMDLIIVRYGRCNGCQEYQTIYEPVGDLLMEAHPTMRLGACLVCWAQMVAFVLALQEHGEDEPS